MNVLIPEACSAAGAELEASATRLGHTVFRCHEIDAPGNECVAGYGRPCPLDKYPIDVAVLAGRAGGDTLTCAQRHRIPVAFVPWPSRRGLAAAIATATDDLAVHARIAEAAMRHALSVRGIDAQGVAARARRRTGGVWVQLAVPGGLDAKTRHEVGVAVHSAVRRFDDWAPVIDIAIADAGRDRSPAIRPNVLAAGRVRP